MAGSESGLFDLAEFAGCIDEERTDRGLTWAELGREVGVAVSTIRRFAVAADAEADGVLALVGWLGAAPEHFIIESTVVGLPLAQAGDGVIRVDMGLVDKLDAGPRGSRPRTRTTIQRLVAVAQSTGTPIASLTRWSAV